MTDTGIETTTVHDYKPTHRFAPPEVEEARENMFAAWAEHRALCDLREDGKMGIGPVLDAAKRAIQAEAEYRHLWDAWQNEPDECTCTPRGECQSCRGRAHATAKLLSLGYDIEIPY